MDKNTIEGGAKRKTEEQEEQEGQEEQKGPPKKAKKASSKQASSEQALALAPAAKTESEKVLIPPPALASEPAPAFALVLAPAAKTESEKALSALASEPAPAAKTESEKALSALASEPAPALALAPAAKTESEKASSAPASATNDSLLGDTNPRQQQQLTDRYNKIIKNIQHISPSMVLGMIKHDMTTYNIIIYQISLFLDYKNAEMKDIIKTKYKITELDKKQKEMQYSFIDVLLNKLIKSEKLKSESNILAIAKHLIELNKDYLHIYKQLKDQFNQK